MGDKSYVVTGACAIVNTDDGRAVTVMNGGPAPSNASPEAIDHLLSVGLITEGEPVGGIEPVRRGDQPVPRPADLAPGVDDVDGPDGPIPPKSAPKDAWVAYAVSKGAVQAEAEALSRDALAAAYGG